MPRSNPSTTPPTAQEPRAGRRIGYARVSTAEQRADLQRDALSRAGCIRVYVDEDRSGSDRDRPALAKALRALRAGDSLIVWKLDRLARSLQDLLDIAGELRQRGVAFESLTEKLDTGSAYGEFIFHIIGAVAQMERRLIAERTRAGLDAARGRGVRLGRRPKLDDDAAREAQLLLAGGLAGIADIAARHQVAGITVTRAIARIGQPQPRRTGGHRRACPRRPHQTKGPPPWTATPPTP